MSGNKNLSK